jgi:aminomethyltransferase
MHQAHNLQNTCLYNEHKNQGAHLAAFGQWEMPIRYASIIQEHRFVRSNCGVFDVSHMGEILISGENAKSFLQKMTSNDLEKITVGKSQYTTILNNQGGIIDDLIVYQLSDTSYLLCVNASNSQKDFIWLKEHSLSYSKLSVEDSSCAWGQIAIQGPNSQKITESLCPQAKEKTKTLSFGTYFKAQVKNQNILIARTGYTGERGYEVYAPEETIRELWQNIFSTHSREDVIPVGLGARDTLRLEACYPLYGQELNENLSPLETGLTWVTKLYKEDFIGKNNLIKQKENGVNKNIYAFKMQDPGIARANMKVYQEDILLGEVSSGSFLPTLNFSGGLAILNCKKIDLTKLLEIEIRGKRKRAELIKKPMYQAKIKS